MLKNKINIIPKPVSMFLGEGGFKVTEQTQIESDPKLNNIAKYLKDLIFPSTGFNLTITDLNTNLAKSNVIYLKLNEKASDLNEEGYSLNVNKERIVLSAPKPVGIFYGIQTIRQLLPLEIEKKKKYPALNGLFLLLILKIIPVFLGEGTCLMKADIFWEKKL